MSASSHVFLAPPGYGLKITETGHPSVGHTSPPRMSQQRAAHTVSFCQSWGWGVSSPHPLELPIKSLTAMLLRILFFNSPYT